jgi:predicted negative regulator of RcsB-dependent stress response
VALWQKHPQKSWRIWAALGDAHRVMNRPELARLAYEEALARAAEPPPAVLADLATLLGGPLQAPGQSVERWREYLDAAPDGSAAPLALWVVAQAELEAGNASDAEDRLRTLLTRHPGSRQAALALARLGRLFVDAEDWDAAIELFESHQHSRRASEVEVALVGLARAHMAQGHRDEARAALAAYRQRFPNGARIDEVTHLEAALAQ